MNDLIISKKIDHRMKALSILIVILISAAAPLIYFYLEFKDENAKASFNAEKYAVKFERAIQENPKYWHLNLEKFIEIFSERQVEMEIAVIEVYDTEHQLLHQEVFQNIPRYTLEQTKEIHYNNKLYGYITVYSSLVHLIRNGIMLAFLFLMAGLVIVKYVCDANSLLLQLEEANAELGRLAITDEKTGLLNATTSAEKLRAAIEEPRQPGKGLCLLLVDIDYFKKYNDTYGHMEGDKILSQVAEVLKVNAGKLDSVGRFGGDKFIIVMPCSTEEAGLESAQNIQRAIKQMHFPGEEYLPKGKLTVSIGLVYNAEEGMNPRELMNQADKALYWAKEAGRNTIRQYNKNKILTEGLLGLNMAEEYPAMKQEITGKALDKFIKNVNEYMYDVYEPTARSLLKALEIWEVETVKHSLRVNRIAMEIAKKMGLSLKELSNLNIGTLLHDIGKLSVGDSILLKTQALTEEEYELMKNHPKVGFSIVSDNKLLNDASKVILYHHERFDGKGYPNQLKGTEIPLLARICSLADAFDAMSSDRPYKKGISLEEAKREIALCSGSQFDPQVVTAFLQISNEQLE